MTRLALIVSLVAALFAVTPVAARAAVPAARGPVLVASTAVAPSALPVARFGFGLRRSYGYGRSRYGYGYNRRGYGVFSRRGHGFAHGLFWGFLLGHWFSGGGFPVFPFVLIGFFLWMTLRSRRRRSRWSPGY